jgi:hypothetical protein
LLFTPAAGYRSHEMGALNVVGAYGYAWSSSTFASGNFDAGHLRFFESEVTPVHGFYRARSVFPCAASKHLHEVVFRDRRSAKSLRLTAESLAGRDLIVIFVPCGLVARDLSGCRQTERWFSPGRGRARS